MENKQNQYRAETFKGNTATAPATSSANFDIGRTESNLKKWQQC